MNHRPRKRFGQHFLHDPATIARLLEAIHPQPGEHFVEIGPGKGALTFPLLERVGALDVVELDRDLAARLQRQAATHDNFCVHQADALEFDLRPLAAARPLRVAGNLPYNVSTPLLFHLLAQSSAILDMHFMLQQEVVARLAAVPGSKDYGRLSVMVQYRCRVARLFGVAPGAFSPPPKVDSTVVRLTPHQAPPVEVGSEAAFSRIVAQAFGQRRKTLRNALAGRLDAQAIAAAGVDPGVRAETLPLEAFAALSRQCCTGGRNSF